MVFFDNIIPLRVLFLLLQDRLSKPISKLHGNEVSASVNNVL